MSGEPITRGPRVGVDVGSVRVGLAVSDPDGLVATPVETVARDQSPAAGAIPADIARIAGFVAEKCAAIVYVGLPRHLSGEVGAAAQGALSYAAQLSRAITPVPVHLVDERMTTMTAHQQLYAAGRSSRRHRTVVDQAAAVIILQTALETERLVGARAGTRSGGPEQ